MAKWYLVPWLADKPIHQALTVLIFPHALRHVGLTFFVPGVVAQPLPSFFANTVAYGDFVSGLLALLSLLALRGGWSLALPLVWVFNIVGTADLLNALRHADAVPDFGGDLVHTDILGAVLLVTHAMIFARLLKRER